MSPVRAWWIGGLLIACGSVEATPPSIDAGGDEPSADATSAPDVVAPDAAVEAGVDTATIAAPRLVSPMNTATVSSQTPKISWQLPADVSSAHVEFSKAREFGTIEASFDATGTSGAPTSPLSPGVHFVRVAGRSNGTVGAQRSAVWEIRVGYKSAPRDTSYGAFPDFDGDGLADVLAAGGSAFVDVFRGTKLGPSTSSVAHIADPSHQGTDNFPRAAFGDIDGDGFSDLVVGDITTTSNDQTNRISVYRGGPTGLDGTSKPAWVINVPTVAADAGFTSYSFFAGSVSVPGDLNGDGYADVMASSLTSGGSVNGPTFVFFGHAAGPSATPDATIHGEGVAYQFFPAGNIGDVDGDGYADVIGTTEADWGVWLFPGGPMGPSDANRHPLTKPAQAQNGNFGGVISGAGDLDGDGYPDFAISAVGAVRTQNYQGPYGPGQTYVYRGEAGPGLFTSDWTLTGPDGGGGNFGNGAIAGDLDADGYDDMVIGAPLLFGNAGRAYYFKGGPSGVTDGNRTTLVGPNGGYFGSAAQAGDLNGDGYPDVLIAAPVYGLIDVFYGGKGLDDNTTHTSLTSPSFIYILAERARSHGRTG